eukprot:TRINITY_DN10703_c0_g1_i1.p1 TRINITY_DN10703_c0_g1~~TRINITY_DN10703_c0_g1_i1.p1  ORF type:complete len:416 (-),score=88.54 TRINITY_DN10703_c0_g1_i1:14-1087(-)
MRNLSVAGVNDTSDLLVDVNNSVATVVLNRPKQLNALNLDMVRKLYPLYKNWQTSDEVNLIVMKGEGKGFCAGGDIVAICKAGLEGDFTLAKDFFSEEYNLNYTIGTSNVPQIAILDGPTMGGGVGLSVHGKYRVATENTVFAMPETAIGFFCDVGGTYFLPRLQGELGMYLALTGKRLMGFDNVKAGIATHYVPSERIEELENQLNSLDSFETTKIESVLDGYSQVIEHDSSYNIDEVNTLFGGSSVEEIMNSLAENNGAFAQSCKKSIDRFSPTSIKVVYKQVRTGKTLGFRDTFELEYKISQEFMRNKDFYEGVRSLLVDKDKAFRWDPPTLDQVRDEVVEKYFTAEDQMKWLE